MKLKPIFKWSVLFILVCALAMIASDLKMSRKTIADLLFLREAKAAQNDSSSDIDWWEVIKEEKEKRKSQIDEYIYARAVDKAIKTLGFEDAINDFTKRKWYSLEDVIEFPFVKKSYILSLGYEHTWPPDYFAIGVKKSEYLELGDYIALNTENPRWVSTACAYFLEISHPDKECEFNQMIRIEDIEINTEEKALELVKAFIELTSRGLGRLLFLDSTQDIKIYLNVSNSTDYVNRRDEKAIRLATQRSISHISKNEIFKDWKKYKGNDSSYKEIDKYKEIVHPPKVKASRLGIYYVTLFTWKLGRLVKWKFEVYRNGTLDWERNTFTNN